ncbi:hypothetical protein MMC12_000523 [Toensbergia leucococca]|nr:hypothetical protein [Toensbergia leucococca]
MSHQGEKRAPSPSPIPYFKCTRLNQSTFVIVEDDKSEHPFIYAKLYNDPPLVVLSDTGCGGLSRSAEPSLRHFIETHPVTANENQPLNPHQGDGKLSRQYLIICTHCHYDHILGIPCFKTVKPTILASSHEKSFIEDDLPEHSLCLFLGIPTPEYSVSFWAADFESIIFEGSPLGLQVLHTPGHTPDELAWYDEEERYLYVGDSFYERVSGDNSYAQPIIFPNEGNLIQYMSSLEKLISFVSGKNSKLDRTPIKIGCGHITSSTDAIGILLPVRQLFQNIIAGETPIKQSTEKRGEIVDLWQEDGDPRFSVEAPRRLVTDARKDECF